MSDVVVERFPKSILLGAAGVVFIALVAATSARLTGTGVTDMNPAVAAAQVRELRFEDMSDGSIGVFKAAEDRPAEILTAGNAGFVRNVMRSMARERKQIGIGSDKPFRLVRWEDGRLSIEDPSTARHIDLGAFGSANERAFARLMGRERAQ